VLHTTSPHDVGLSAKNRSMDDSSAIPRVIRPSAKNKGVWLHEWVRRSPDTRYIASDTAKVGGTKLCRVVAEGQEVAAFPSSRGLGPEGDLRDFGKQLDHAVCSAGNTSACQLYL